MIRTMLIFFLIGVAIAEGLAIHQAPKLIVTELSQKYFMLPKDKWEGSMFDINDHHYTQFEEKDRL